MVSTLFLVFLAAFVGGVGAQLLRLPSVVGYIASGVIFGNIFTGGLDRPFLQTTATVGVTLLMFTLGVEFSFHRLGKVLSHVWPLVLLQILFCFLVLFGLTQLLRLDWITGVYLAFATSLSSTAIAIKILSEKGELATVPGELSTGWLVVQDLFVVPVMVFLPLISLINSSSSNYLVLLTDVSLGLFKSGFILGAIFFLGRVGVPGLLGKIATLGSREMFLLTTVAVVFLSAATTAAAGLGTALGAFLAGLLVAQTSESHEVFAEVRPLRDLFGIAFFVSLGLTLPLAVIVRNGWWLLGITTTALAIKFIAVFVLSRMSGFHRRTAFQVGLSLLPMSEFGLILAGEGVRIGLLTAENQTLLVALTFISIMLTLPFLASRDLVYDFLTRQVFARLPALFANRSSLLGEKAVELPFRGHVVLCGYGRVGRYIGRALTMSEIPFVVVDYNHTTVAKLRSEGLNVVYGDPADKEVLDVAQVDFARVLVIAIPDRHTQELVIGHALTLNKHIKIICRTHHEGDQRHLKSLGVATVIQPEFEAAISIVSRLLSDFKASESEVAGRLARLKLEHGLG